MSRRWKFTLRSKENWLAKQKALVNNLEKDKAYGRSKRDLWMLLERMLRKDFNVHASTYHGGDMEGNECRCLLRNAVLIFAAVKDILISYLEELEPDERVGKASKQEIDLFLGGFQRLFQYVDLISHFGYQPFGSLSDEDLEAANKTVTLAADLWKRLMPTVPIKVHT